MRFIKAFSRYCLHLLLVCTVAHAQNAPNAGLRSLQVDAGNKIGRIRSLQGVNGPPSPEMAGLPNLVEQYKDLRVNQVRTHDCMGPTDIDARFIENNPMLAWL